MLGAVADFFRCRYAGFIQHCEEQIRHRRIVWITDVLPTAQRAGSAARDEHRRVHVVVQISIT